ncbi:hypothetical protein M405DRAFT_869550 [Rhizopogon salebrosus TDB-379]|nr:hypothetical protein M405DRAFT_869550 [Rhizopogon salebrosus TDB-379]
MPPRPCPAKKRGGQPQPPTESGEEFRLSDVASDSDVRSPFNGSSHGGPMEYNVAIAHGWAVAAIVPNADGWARSL